MRLPAAACRKCQELSRQLTFWRNRDWMRKLKARGEAHGQRREQRSAVPVHQGGAWLGAVVESSVGNVMDGAEQLAGASQALGGSNHAMRARKHISATGSAQYDTDLLYMDCSIAELLGLDSRFNRFAGLVPR